MPDTLFELSRYENHNGSTSWQVTGFLHGIRIRKIFKKREAAAAEMATLEIKAIQASSGLRSIATALTEEQTREAEDRIVVEVARLGRMRVLIGWNWPRSFPNLSTSLECEG